MNILSDFTTWNYMEDYWLCWENMKFSQFTKGDFQKDKKTITIANFIEFIKRNPLSWAMTSGTNIEYTLEEPDKLLLNK